MRFYSKLEFRRNPETEQKARKALEKPQKPLQNMKNPGAVMAPGLALLAEWEGFEPSVRF